MVPQNDKWAGLIEKCYGKNAKKVSRYAIKKEKDIFDKCKLQQAVLQLPGGYELKHLLLILHLLEQLRLIPVFYNYYNF